MERHPGYRDYCAANRNNDDDELASIIDRLRREFHKSLDLNYPMVQSTLFEFDLPFLKPQRCNKETGGVRWPLISESTRRKRSLVEMEMRQIEEERDKKKINGVDLSLRLSPFGMRKEEVWKTNQAERSSASTTSQLSCMSLDMNSINESLEEMMSGNINEAVSSLILMGCSGCLIYVMVSEEDPKCPKCKSSVLIDVFHRSNSAKRSRKS